MRIPRFAVVLLPSLAFTLVQPGFAQTEALLKAPLPSANASGSALPNDPAFSSSSALPGDPAFAPGYYPVERAPQGPVNTEPKLKVMDWSLISAASVLRVLDYTSTEKAMADPAQFREAMLPTKLVENKAAFAAFQAATVGVDYTAYRLLVRHHMRPLARVAQYVYVSGMAFQVGRNYQTLGSVPATPAN
ncbi:MAG: hypothetical protein WA399_06985 [Acidobacteriaceae bacterium]